MVVALGVVFATQLEVQGGVRNCVGARGPGRVPRCSGRADCRAAWGRFPYHPCNAVPREVFGEFAWEQIVVGVVLNCGEHYPDNALERARWVPVYPLSYSTERYAGGSTKVEPVNAGGDATERYRSKAVRVGTIQGRQVRNS